KWDFDADHGGKIGNYRGRRLLLRKHIDDHRKTNGVANDGTAFPHAIVKASQSCPHVQKERYFSLHSPMARGLVKVSSSGLDHALKLPLGVASYRQGHAHALLRGAIRFCPH